MLRRIESVIKNIGGLETQIKGHHEFIVGQLCSLTFIIISVTMAMASAVNVQKYASITESVSISSYIIN